MKRLLLALALAACAVPAWATTSCPNCISVINNITALTGKDWTDYRAGGLYLLGYNTPGDGGGGFFVPQSSCPNGADGGTGFQDSASNWWCRPDGPGTLNNLKFGAKVDNSSDDTLAVKNYIAYLAQFGNKGDIGNFVCNPLQATCISNTNPFTVPEGVVISCGDHAGMDPSITNPFSFSITGTGAWGVILGNGSNQYGAGMVGCRVFGQGSGTTMGGVLIDGFYGRFERNRVFNFSEQDILACNGSTDPVAACTTGSHVWRIRDNIFSAGLLKHTTSGTLLARIGICQIEGQDNQFEHNECNAAVGGLTTVTNSTNLYRDAIYLTGSSANFLTEENVGEFADVGIYVDGITYSQQDNASDNYGIGVWATTNSSGTFTALSANQNSTNNSTTFDEMKVDGCCKQFNGFTIPGTVIKPKFGIEDTFVNGSGGSANVYDAGTMAAIGGVATNVGFKAFSNQTYGSTANAPDGAPFQVTPATGSSNFCVDNFGDRGSIFFVNPGSAATVTIATSCSSVTQGWDGMRLRVFIQTNVTVDDSNGTAKTVGSPNTWHQLTLQNGAWVFDY